MAIWQFTIVLIPTAWVEKEKFDLSHLQTEDGFTTGCTWIERQPECKLGDVFDTILPPIKSWDDEVLIWGNTKTHDIQVIYENGLLEDIVVRLDLNLELSKIIVQIVNAARTLNCVFFIPESDSVVLANEIGLVDAVHKSNAAKYVTNPREYLDGISKQT
jgi:hypothetical protein